MKIMISKVKLDVLIVEIKYQSSKLILKGINSTGEKKI